MIADLSFVREITPGTVGIFSLLAVVSVALIKAWPVLALQAQNARDKLRSEQRTDLNDCKARIDKLQNELNGVREEVHKIEMKLVGAITAYRILDKEVEAHMPSSTALAQARLAMSAAFTLSPSTDAPLEEWPPETQQ
jgi:hypothetical protein